jgi:hypothetical protein
MWLLVAGLFVIAVVGVVATVYQLMVNKLLDSNHEVKMAAYKKVGSWYEARVVELEEENRNLAQQIVDSLGHPAVAMPPWPTDPLGEYASDATGLLIERLPVE